MLDDSMFEAAGRSVFSGVTNIFSGFNEYRIFSNVHGVIADATLDTEGTRSLPFHDSRLLSGTPLCHERLLGLPPDSPLFRTTLAAMLSDSTLLEV